LAKISISKKFGGNIKIVRTEHLLCRKVAAVCLSSVRKLQCRVLPLFIPHAAVFAAWKVWSNFSNTPFTRWSWLDELARWADSSS